MLLAGFSVVPPLSRKASEEIQKIHRQRAVGPELQPDHTIGLAQ